MIANYFSVSMLDIFALIILAYMIFQNKVLDENRTRFYLTGLCLVLLSIIAEIGTTVFTGTDRMQIILNTASNIIGFSVSPLIPIIISQVFSKKKYRFARLLMLPGLLNVAATLLSLKFDIIFNISAEGIYSRGKLFFIYIAASIWGMAIFLNSVGESAKHYPRKTKISLWLLFSFIIIGTSVQVIFPGIHTTWSCITLSMIIYYAFICELSDNHDVLTDMWNRRAYEKEFKRLSETDGASIIIFDVDNFKSVNDNYGHQYGDYCLSIIAGNIFDIYSDFGLCCRIGGDEFCVLSEQTDFDRINELSEKFNQHMNQTISHEISIPGVSVGFSVYDKDSKISMAHAFEQADANMYINKRLRKEAVKSVLKMSKK